jgi:hypothetical protein
VQPQAAFTQAVMARVVRIDGRQSARSISDSISRSPPGSWSSSPRLGLAWSLGLLSVTIDVDAIVRSLDAGATGLLSRVQTVAMSAVLLTMALVLWWWAEAASD